MPVLPALLFRAHRKPLGADGISADASLLCGQVDGGSRCRVAHAALSFSEASFISDIAGPYNLPGSRASFVAPTSLILLLNAGGEPNQLMITAKAQFFDLLCLGERFHYR